MSLQGLVDATATALGGARELYGQAPTATGLPSTSGLQNLKTDLRTSLDTVPATWGGRGGEGYKQAGGNGITALDNVISADGRVGPQVVSASNESRDRRAGMNGVVSDTRATRSTSGRGPPPRTSTWTSTRARPPEVRRATSAPPPEPSAGDHRGGVCIHIDRGLRRALETQPEQVDHQLGRFIDVGVAGAHPAVGYAGRQGAW